MRQLLRAFLLGILILSTVGPGIAGEDGVVRLALVGDIMLGGSMGGRLKSYGARLPFSQTSAFLGEFDCVIGNLECPLTTANTLTSGKSAVALAEGRDFAFKADPTLAIAALRHGSLDAVSIANNHSMDYGVEGMRETLRTLQTAELPHAGGGLTREAARAPIDLSRDGVRIGFLACSMINPLYSSATAQSPGTFAIAKGWTPELEQSITRAADEFDVLILSIHWGVESTTELTPYQVAVGHRAIESGVDLVMGHHPHVVQRFERYQEGLIAYSLGNFAMTSPSTFQRSALLEVAVDANGIRAAQVHPIAIESGVPRLCYEPRVVEAIAVLAGGLPLAPAF